MGPMDGWYQMTHRGYPLLTEEAPVYGLLVNRLLVVNREGCLSEIS